MLKDIDIRKGLLTKLHKQNASHDYRIIEELAICDGSSRVDIAVANGKLCGYEIKSDADSLDRLKTQQLDYDKTFDYITIVVGQKFNEAIHQHVPEYWGIYVAYECANGSIKFKVKRTAKKNPNTDSCALLDLLWKEEISTLLKSNSIGGISGKNRRLLRRLTLEHLSKKQISDFTRETLKSREGWRA